MPKAATELNDAIRRNAHECLKTNWGDSRFLWVKENTAIMLIHGIGNQLPMETLDQFGSGLVHAFKEVSKDEFIVEHHLRKKSIDGDSKPDWYDNILRIRKAGDPYYIDLYEYYWAHYTEGKADWNDISDWIKGITKGARKYYKRNEELAKQYGDESPLTIKSPKWRYYLFINTISYFLVFWQVVKNLFSRIPYIGRLSGSINGFTRSTSTIITNIIGDLVAYMVTDAKSKYYPVRRAILDGAVKAFSFLLEDCEKDANGKSVGRSYPAVILAGHSLGSQISYDVLNRINLMINHEEIKNYNKNGICSITGKKISEQIKGLITFGSPLDKTAFFLRENIPDEQFVRQQMLNDFLDFKQRDWTPHLSTVKGFFEVKNIATPYKFLEDIPWRNYHDTKDYVSGELDYYKGLTNVDCCFGQTGFFAFTHSNYWSCEDFYKDIIFNFLQ